MKHERVKRQSFADFIAEQQAGLPAFVVDRAALRASDRAATAAADAERFDKPWAARIEDMIG